MRRDHPKSGKSERPSVWDLTSILCGLRDDASVILKEARFEMEGGAHDHEARWIRKLALDSRKPWALGSRSAMDLGEFPWTRELCGRLNLGTPLDLGTPWALGFGNSPAFENSMGSWIRELADFWKSQSPLAMQALLEV